MVIGNGMIARRFSAYRDDDRFLVFASGVSNSKTHDAAAYERESGLLKEAIAAHPEKTIVYFSTCSIYDPVEKESRYALHKQEMESFIGQNAGSYYIFRVSNLAGRSANPNTILNFLYYHITNRINFDCWVHSTRNLIDTDDMYAIADHIMQNGLFRNQVINIANPRSYPVPEIVNMIGTHTGIKPNYIIIEKGNHFSIDISLILDIIQKLDLHFEGEYLKRLLKKYYPSS